MFQIDSGIPAPALRPRATGLTNVMRQLKVGDSFLVPKSSRSNIGQTAMRCGVKVVTRSVDNDMIRVWRVA